MGNRRQVATTDGKVVARTFKGAPLETRFDQEIFKGCSGLPWDLLAVPTAHDRTGNITPTPAVTVDDPAWPDLQEETPAQEDPREHVEVRPPPLQEPEVRKSEDVIPVLWRLTLQAVGMLKQMIQCCFQPQEANGQQKRT